MGAVGKIWIAWLNTPHRVYIESVVWHGRRCVGCHTDERGGQEHGFQELKLVKATGVGVLRYAVQCYVQRQTYQANQGRRGDGGGVCIRT